MGHNNSPPEHGGNPDFPVGEGGPRTRSLLPAAVMTSSSPSAHCTDTLAIYISWPKTLRCVLSPRCCLVSFFLFLFVTFLCFLHILTSNLHTYTLPLFLGLRHTLSCSLCGGKFYTRRHYNGQSYFVHTTPTEYISVSSVSVSMAQALAKLSP